MHKNWLRRVSVFILLVVALLIYGYSFFSRGQPLTIREIKENFEKLEHRKIPFTASTGHSDINDVYKSEENLSIEVNSPQDCYLSIFIGTPPGDLIQLFPNPKAKDNLVKAQNTKRFPEKGIYNIGKTDQSFTKFFKIFVTADPEPIFPESDLEAKGSTYKVKPASEVYSRFFSTLERIDERYSVITIPMHVSGSNEDPPTYDIAAQNDWAARAWVWSAQRTMNEPFIVRMFSNKPASIVMVQGILPDGQRFDLLPDGKQIPLNINEIARLNVATGTVRANLPTGLSTFNLEIQVANEKGLKQILTLPTIIIPDKDSPVISTPASLSSPLIVQGTQSSPQDQITEVGDDQVGVPAEDKGDPDWWKKQPDLKQEDKAIKTVIGKFEKALASRDIEQSAAFFSPEEKETYKKVFAMSPDLMPQMAKDMKNASLSFLSLDKDHSLNRIAEYSFDVQGNRFRIVFVKIDGNWLLASF